MPTIKFAGLYFEETTEERLAWVKLRGRVAEIAKVDRSVVEFRLTNAEAGSLEGIVTERGQLDEAPVSVDVFWFAGRSAEQKQAVASAISDFLIEVGQYNGHATTFHDESPGDYFYEGKQE
jgi:phenylpyruvate tautomerase PptA (4-oxalocrotonate tautomerase family)